jgi:hypothetical protein
MFVFLFHNYFLLLGIMWKKTNLISLFRTLVRRCHGQHEISKSTLEKTERATKNGRHRQH